MLVGQDLAADTQDHRTVTADKGRKRFFLLCAYEAFQQLPVRESSELLPYRYLADKSKDRFITNGRHRDAFR
jgi:hypothetical protein